ncbi:hypothetical protein EH230_11890 [Flavobacterium columnare]|uniref:Uncharacterized protein n=1 Tax=Flavobacterium columnare TaxID=996 RepID=A0A437UD35_9FLAO|nr:hypothetical protein [Flavobacterium columnare]RVU91544.1 hypothetical protein EH230_11890 [Flavobacterium columnare]
MAYLTASSFNQLVNNTEIKNLDRIDLQFFISNIIDKQQLFYFFNQFDLKKIFKEKLILSGDDSYGLYYKEVPERKDNLNYVLKLKGKVKYHKSKECEALNRGFKNFFMPPEIVKLKNTNESKHNIIVNEIREWFNANNFTIERYENGEINSNTITRLYNDYFPEKFGLQRISTSQSNNESNDFQWYVNKKSENIQLDKSYFDYNEFLKNIEDLIIKREYLCNSKTMQNLSRYDYLFESNVNDITAVISSRIESSILKEVDVNFINNYGVNRLKDFWKKHRELRLKAYSELSEYFKWNYKLKEKNFDVVYLEDFNLECCILCANK